MLLDNYNARTFIDDAPNKFKHTPLTIAIKWNGDLEMAKILFEEGRANKNKVGCENKMPLEWA